MGTITTVILPMNDQQKEAVIKLIRALPTTTTQPNTTAAALTAEEMEVVLLYVLPLSPKSNQLHYLHLLFLSLL